MSDIKIIVDTCADMPEDLRRRYNIGLIGFYSVFGDKSYKTGVDITNAEFFDMLDSEDIFPKTSQPAFADIYDCLLKESRAHETVIFFTMSSKASGEYNTASMAARQISEEDNPSADIRVVDTNLFSVYIADGAVYAAKCAASGDTADVVIKKALARMNQWRAMLLVDTLKYLEKGGRLNKATAFIGTLLDIKPVLAIEGGLVVFDDKLRGRKKLLDKLIAKMRGREDFDSDNPKFLLAHSDADLCVRLCDKLTAEYGEGCVDMICEFGPIVGTHTGRHAVALLYKTKAN